MVFVMILRLKLKDDGISYLHVTVVRGYGYGRINRGDAPPGQTRPTPHSKIYAVPLCDGRLGAEPAIWVEFQGVGEECGI